MRNLPTQFDTGRLSAAVGTPSCCGCSCCCCCCVGTVIGAPIVIGQQLAESGRKNKVPRYEAWVAVGVLAMVLGAAFGGLTRVVNQALHVGPGEPPPEPAFIAAVLATGALLVLAFWKVRRPRPVVSALLTALVVVAAFAVEAGVIFLGFTTGAGWILYLVLLPVLTVVIPVLVRRRIRARQGAGSVPDPQEAPDAT